jgi:hypothetical protein
MFDLFRVCARSRRTCRIRTLDSLESLTCVGLSTTIVRFAWDVTTGSLESCPTVLLPCRNMMTKDVLLRRQIQQARWPSCSRAGPTSRVEVSVRYTSQPCRIGDISKLALYRERLDGRFPLPQSRDSPGAKSIASAAIVRFAELQSAWGSVQRYTCLCRVEVL